MQKYKIKLRLQNIMWKNIKGKGDKKGRDRHIKEPVPECGSMSLSESLSLSGINWGQALLVRVCLSPPIR